MADAIPVAGPVRREIHFGDRALTCFSPRPSDMLAVFRASVEKAPSREAVRDADRALTYAGLDAEADRLAAGLVALGMTPGERLALNTANRIEFVAGLLAAFKAGLIAMPVGHRHRRSELAELYADAGVAAVLFDAETAAEQPDQSEVPTLRLTIGAGAQIAGSLDYGAVLAAGEGRTLAAPVIDEDACALLMYTSGTTGRPKGAKITHLGMVHTMMHYVAGLGMTDEEVSVLAVPCTHITGLGAQLLVMFGCAGTLVMMPKFDTTAFVDLAATYRMTHTALVPAMYALLLHRKALQPGTLRDWRVGAFGGAPMPEAIKTGLAELFPNLGLHNLYGATETTSPTAFVQLGMPEVADSVGRAVTCGDLRIVDDAGNDVPDGREGELWIKGPMVIPGYWENPEADAASFVDGFWRSGDIASRDADGNIRIHDRKKDMINRGGYKIFSAEIENLLLELAGVEEAALVPYPCPILGERAHAHVYAGKAAVTEDMVRAFLAERVADYKVPDRITIRSEPLPRNVNGKLVKVGLRMEETQ